MSIQTYIDSYNTRVTPQTEPIPGREAEMEKNNAGGFSFTVDDWKRLERFLILGSEGGTYYVGERALTKDNAQVVQRCIKADGLRTVKTIRDISFAGRAPKNSPALFALAMASKLGDEATRRAALDAVQDVCRTGTHLFEFLSAVQAFGGWGRATKRAVQNWYTGKTPERLALQLVKYRQREGWTHRDVLRKAHPQSESAGALLAWAAGKGPAPSGLAEAFEAAQKATSEQEVIRLIHEHALPREALPTEWLNSAAVWEALLYAGDGMPITALIRNLGKMSAVGLIKPLGSAEKVIAQMVSDQDRLNRGRVHPLSILLALTTYQQGRGVRGSLSWTPSQKVIDALDAAFYMAFDAVEPTNKRHLIALDVSSSMEWSDIAGTHITPRVASAAMSLVTAAKEPAHHFVGFSDQLVPLDISPRQRLNAVVRTINRIPMGRTDCSQPMLYALKHKIEVDTFVVYTDNETWAGYIQPVQALQQYRREMGIPAKLIVVGMTATGFTIADPKDAGMLDVVGFDAAAPAVMADFSR